MAHQSPDAQQQQQQQQQQQVTPREPLNQRLPSHNSATAIPAADNPTDQSSTRSQSHVTDAPPPFWSTTRHSRSVSTVSYHSLLSQSRPAPILLEDHSEEQHEQTRACWAKSVSIDEYVCVTGPSGVGAYIVWHCQVETLKGGRLDLRKRYSEFDALRTSLVRSFPHADAMIPQLPRKSVVSRFRPKFLEQRRAGLIHFLNCILLNPEFAASPVLKDFIFS
nr:px domain-containing protein ypt35 [Quercus suber]